MKSGERPVIHRTVQAWPAAGGHDRTARRHSRKITDRLGEEEDQHRERHRRADADPREVGVDDRAGEERQAGAEHRATPPRERTEEGLAQPRADRPVPPHPPELLHRARGRGRDVERRGHEADDPVSGMEEAVRPGAERVDEDEPAQPAREPRERVGRVSDQDEPPVARPGHHPPRQPREDGDGVEGGARQDEAARVDDREHVDQPVPDRPSAAVKVRRAHHAGERPDDPHGAEERVLGRDQAGREERRQPERQAEGALPPRPGGDRGGGEDDHHDEGKGTPQGHEIQTRTT